MILIKLVKNKNKTIKEAYGKYYARPVVTETIGIDKLAEHMASHNTPFSKRCYQGPSHRYGELREGARTPEQGCEDRQPCHLLHRHHQQDGSRQHQGVEPRQVCRGLPPQSPCYRQAQQHPALSRCQRQERHGSPQL